MFLNILNMGNDSGNDTNKVDFSNLIFGTNQIFIIGQRTFVRSISLNYNYQTSDNKSVMIKNGTTNIHSLNLGIAYFVNENILLNSSAGLVNSVIYDTLKSTTSNISLGMQHNALKNKLRSSLTLTNSFLESSNTIRISLQSSYSITRQDFISLLFSTMNFRGSNSISSRFDEITAALKYSHRF